MIRNTGAETLLCDREVPRAEIVVAFIMCVYADNQGLFVGSLDDLAKRIGYGRSIVWDALKALEARGYIEKGHKRGVWQIKGELCEPADKAVRSYMASAS